MSTLPSPDCPLGGRKTGQWNSNHAVRPWGDPKIRSGLSCRKCHKTWEWFGLTLRPTYREGSPT